MDIYNTLPPRHEEELLPPYECTVFKYGHVKLKKEITHGRREVDRSWKTVYFKLTGTLLQVYKKATDTKPIFKISMHKTFCGYPIDYLKKDDVLRLTVGNEADQYLFRPVGGLVQVVSWFEHLHSATNISADIDTRRMPRLLYYNRENTPVRQHVAQVRTITLKLGTIQVYVPILACLEEICKPSILLSYL